MAAAGDRVRDPLIGVEVIFRRTAADTDGALLEMEARVRPRWWAGPLHLHPRQEESIEVLAGELAVCKGTGEERCRAGERLFIPPATPHEIWNPADRDARLLIQFRPALRTEALFETTVGLGRLRHTQTPVRELLRLLIASRAYRDEFHVVWRGLVPRRLRRRRPFRSGRFHT